MHIGEIYAHIYATYEVTGINQSIRSIEHTFNISLNKYGCHIQNAAHTANMVHGHVDLKGLHTYSQTQPNATFTSHTITKYVPETNMPTKLGIYAKYFTCILWDVCPYTCHI